jgi:type III secretory pathway lipoprotein EscJ
MENALIACRSVTTAQKAVRLLEKHNIRASMRRLPADLPAESGCGHAIRVRRNMLEQAMKIMVSAGFPSKYFFCEEEDGGVVVCP